MGSGGWNHWPGLYFKQLIEILCCTSCLTTVKAAHSRNDDIKLVLFQKDIYSQHLSKTNKVKMFNLSYNCTLKKHS